MPNGNLLVSGEKQIGLKEGEEFIRFSGVVNPNTITAANTVQSTQVADARIEYKANGFHRLGPGHGLAGALLPDLPALLRESTVMSKRTQVPDRA